MSRTENVHGDLAPQQSGTPGEPNVLQRWRIVRSRAAVVLGSTVGASTLAALVVFLIPPTFESRVVLQVGQVAQEGAALRQLERPQDLAEQLRQEHRLGWPDQPTTLPRITSVSVLDRRGAVGIIELTARARDPEEGRLFLQRVTEGTLARHARLFEQVVGVQREERKRLSATARQMEAEIEGLVQLKGRTPRADAMSAMLVLERARLLAELDAIRLRVAQWDQLLSGASTYETRIIVEPTRPRVPVQPRKALSIALAGLLGLLVTIFVLVARGPGAYRGRRGA